MPAYVIYARKSTDSEDRQVLSIDSQIQELKQLALRRGFKVDEVLTESRSAKAPGRPIFGELMRRIERGEIASVLCWKLDRLARNHADHGRVLQALADHKLTAVVTFERDYTTDGNDRFLGNFELGIATKFIDDLRINVRRGNRARFQRGWPNYRPAQGYLEDHLTKTVFDDPLRFPLVRKMWDLLLSGQMRPRSILDLANSKWGYLTPKRPHSGGKPLTIGSLYAIFHNPYYMGLMRHESGGTDKGAHHAMVTPEEFARAQEILGGRRRPRPVRHEFAYAGLLKCATCGGLLVPEQHIKPSGLRYVYYRCHGRRKSEPCRTPSLSEVAFDASLIREVGRLAVPPRAAEWIRSKLARSLTSDLAQRESTRDSIRKALETAVAEGERLATMRQRDQIDDASYDRRRLEILDRQAKLRAQLEQPDPTTEERLAVLDKAMAFSTQAVELLREHSIVGRRQILQAIGSNWRIEDGKPLYLAKKPFSLMSGGTASSRWWTVLNDVRTWLLSEEALESEHSLTLPESMPRAA